MQNGFIESFNDRPQDELLNERCSTHWPQAASHSDVGGPTTTIHDRPCSSDKKTPSEFAFTCNPRRDLALPTRIVGRRSGQVG